MAIVFGSLFLTAMLIVFAAAVDRGSSNLLAIPYVALLSMLWILPGGLLFYFAGKLDDGKYWAFFPIVALAGFSLLETAVLNFYRFNPCELTLRIPVVLLIACCINGVSPLRDYYRNKRRRQRPRGFEPIVQSPIAAAKTPPPPRRG